MADATGETKELLRGTFDRRLTLEFHRARISSDGSLLAYRELDDALGLTATAAASTLAEGRRGKNIGIGCSALGAAALPLRQPDLRRWCRLRAMSHETAC